MATYFLVLSLLLATFEKEDKSDSDYTSIGSYMVEYGELPYAVYYFTKALEINPDNEIAREKRELVWNELGINAQREFKPWTIPWRELFILLFILLSIWIWYRREWTQKCLYVALGIIVISPIFLFLEKALTPLAGVVVQSSLLYTEGNRESPVVDYKIVRGGEILQVAGYSEDGEWLKVFTADGKFGYIPKKSIRV